MDTNDFSNYRNWINDVKDSDDKELFNEIITCIDSEAYRSSSIMIWILCAESLHKKLTQLSKNNNKIISDLKKWEKEGKNEAELLKLCRKHHLINDIDCNHLNIIRKARNTYAHPNYIAPTKNQVLSYLFFALNSVLSKSSQYSFLEAKNLIELLLRDPYQLGNKNNNQIRTYARRFISKLNPNIYKPILKLLFKLTENVFNDFEPEKQKCIDISLILIEELLIEEPTLLKEELCGQFLNTSRITACNVFSEVEIWNLLDSNTRFKTFKYSSKFEDEILSEIDFINRFDRLNEANLLDEELKNEFREILDKIPIELVFNSEISIKTQFERIINDFKSYDWHVQNPAAKFIRQIDLNIFDDEELEIIGRNLLQAADGRSWESQRTIKSLLRFYDSDNIPSPLIKGIVLEIFLNDKNEFRFKENYYTGVIVKISSKKEFLSIYNNLLKKIKDSFVKNNNFYHYTTSIRRLENMNENYKLERINGIINAIEISRCNSINKLLHETPMGLLEIRFSEDISPHVNTCLNEDDKSAFANLINEDAIKFIKFFSSYSRTFKSKRYSHLDVDFDLIKEFIDLDYVKKIIENKMDEDNTPQVESFCELFLENLKEYDSKNIQ